MEASSLLSNYLKLYFVEQNFTKYVLHRALGLATQDALGKKKWCSWSSTISFIFLLEYYQYVSIFKAQGRAAVKKSI